MKYLKTFENIFANIDIIEDDPIRELRRELIPELEKLDIDIDPNKPQAGGLRITGGKTYTRPNADQTNTEREFDFNAYFYHIERSITDQEYECSFNCNDNYLTYDDDDEVPHEADTYRNIINADTASEMAKMFAQELQNKIDNWAV